MKAFTLYSKNEISLRKLCRKMQDYGTVNCTFDQFTKIYCEWHLTTFKGNPVSTTTALFRDDWFISFLEYFANYNI